MEFIRGRIYGTFQSLDTFSDTPLNVRLASEQVSKGSEGRVVETWHVGVGPGPRAEGVLAFLLDPRCINRRARPAEVWLTVIWAFVISMADVHVAVDIACDS